MTRWLCTAALLLGSACISDNTAALRDYNVSGAAMTVHIVDSPETVGEYVPATAHVKVGEMVAFVNASGDYHTVTFFSGPEVPSSVGIAPGHTFETTLPAAGTYRFRCSYHQGMVGEIVAAASP